MNEMKRMTAVSGTSGFRFDPYPSRLRQSPRQPWWPRLEPPIEGAAKGPLQPSQLAVFERKGFLFEPDFLTPEEVQTLASELESLITNDDYRGRDFTITEPGSQEIRSVFGVHSLSSVFARLASDERLLGRARQILGGECYIHQSRVNYKPAFEGKGFNWHSDFETWHTEDGMPAMRALSASIILTDNHHFNGPLMLIPGSHRIFIPCVGETPDQNHKQSLRTQQIGVPDHQMLGQLMKEHGIEAVTGRAGGLLLFDCNTLHGSNANMSAEPRTNVFFVYNRCDNACERPFAAAERRPEFLAHRPDRRWKPGH